MQLPYAVTLANGSGSRMTAAASATLNNVSRGSALVVVAVPTLTPAAQRNLWGKSTGANRNICAISSAGGIQFQYSAGTAGTDMSSAATFSSWSGIRAGRPLALAVSWDFGVTAAKLYAAPFGGKLSEPSSYVSSVAGTMGSPAHDDSGSALDIGAASGGGNVLDGDLWWLQWWNSPLTLPQIQQAADTLDGRLFGSIAAWAPGISQGTTLYDLSGNSNTVTISGQVRPRAVLLRANNDVPPWQTVRRTLSPVAALAARFYYANQAIGRAALY